MTNDSKSEMGKKSKLAGGQFELRVRHDLEEKGWIVSKWQNNVEFGNCEVTKVNGEKAMDIKKGELIPAKAAYGFNPRLKMRVPLTRSTGFPDFMVYKKAYKSIGESTDKVYEVIGVESKINGALDREEKDKCKWLLDNGIFSKILIAEKRKLKNKVVVLYQDFKEKYWRFYK